MITLVVKAFKAEALAAAKEHDIEAQLKEPDRDGGFIETMLECDSEAIARVIDWYCESNNHKAPFPVGTLLFYMDHN